MTNTENVDSIMEDAIADLVRKLERKISFGWKDDAQPIVDAIAKLRSSMNPPIINNYYGPTS